MKKVTPLDIRKKEFKRSVRGYLDEEVDVFLDEVADEVERIAKANVALEKKVRSLEEEVAGHTHIREALEKTLVAAQMQSEEMRSNAEKQSQSMLKEAESKAKSVVDDLYTQARSVQQTLMQLKLLEEDFRFKFKGMLEGYMKLVDESPALSSTTEVTAESEGGASTAPPAAMPPSLPKNEGGAEDATVEVAPGSVGSGGSVFFGKQQEDLDDPFPEIGGDPATPRDFAW